MASSYTIALSWRNAVFAAALTVVLWGGPWVLLLPTGSAPVAARARRAPPVIRFVRASPALDGTAWSPVMFPLPTKIGFSGMVGLKGQGQNLDGVLKPRPEEPPYLGRAPEPPGVPEGAVVLNSERTAYSPEPVEPPAYMLVHSNRVEGYQAEWYEGLRARGFEAPELARLPPPDGGGAWVALNAWIELDAQGRPAHVFVEQSSGLTNVDMAVVRALRRGQAKAGAGVAAGRARVFYAAREAAGGARGGAEKRGE